MKSTKKTYRDVRLLEKFREWALYQKFPFRKRYDGNPHQMRYPRNSIHLSMLSTFFGGDNADYQNLKRMVNHQW